jgi:hypothetical protein
MVSRILLSFLTRPSRIALAHQLPRQTASIRYLHTMSSKISAVSTKNAPPAMAVYSQAIVANGFVYCSGIPFFRFPFSQQAKSRQTLQET